MASLTRGRFIVKLKSSVAERASFDNGVMSTGNDRLDGAFKTAGVSRARGLRSGNGFAGVKGKSGRGGKSGARSGKGKGKRGGGGAGAASAGRGGGKGALNNVFAMESKLGRKDFMAAFAGDENVEWVEPVRKYGRLGSISDPHYGVQWHMDHLKLPEVHDITEGEGVIVAVVDSGVTEGPDGFYKLLQLKQDFRFIRFIGRGYI